LYVSDSRLTWADQAAILNSIVSVSRAHNAQAAITGALMFTEANFVQFIEGPANAIEILLDKLMRDDRHVNIRILIDQPAAGRRFGRWTLAYHGPPQFIEPEIVAATMSGDSDEAKWQLVDMMVAFAEAGTE
jgi:hypothetical protein